VIAALYVETGGAYFGLPDVDPWDEARDARLYDGPWPVVAHPPCARWSRLAGFTEARYGLQRGEDGGCFAAALAAVRRFGGVIEHPAYSQAWARYGLPKPLWRGGWTAGTCGGWTAYVEQGRYGLPMKKGTWLYAYGCELPELRWGFTPDAEGTNPRDVRSDGTTPGNGGGLHAWRDAFAAVGLKSHTTPEAFRDVLLDMARSALPSFEILPPVLSMSP
jgi:hypothetical protein